jgi:hypothetical protein
VFVDFFEGLTGIPSPPPEIIISFVLSGLAGNQGSKILIPEILGAKYSFFWG